MEPASLIAHPVLIVHADQLAFDVGGFLDHGIQKRPGEDVHHESGRETDPFGLDNARRQVVRQVGLREQGPAD